ncbi:MULTISPECIES: multiubiquitin domain-containing protein [Rhodomicrobium]|uniref:multiubiquitin domain-containing protein n=1 Tax=Rhodomicrobium TaxID=1068 RepID=UPI000B4AE229|nr:MULTISPECIES: multiubiquitin domain-containing protein [Rhodomicrobium]
MTEHPTNKTLTGVEQEENRAAVHDGNGPPSDAVFAIRVGNENLEFRTLRLTDPMPTARQIIEAAGLRPAEEHLLFEISPERRLNELALDETVDIRGQDRERFLVFRSDRSWRGVLDGVRFEWGARQILGRVLKWLAGVDPEKHGVWLERQDEPDQLIGNDQHASLSPAGVERFRTGLLFKLCIEDKVFFWPRDTITTEEIAQLGGWDPSQGVIEVDADQNERQLKPGEVVKLKPGHSFGKKLRFKRGAK